ncbi:hypothetical protein QA639_22850 [Bradyrhizobium pachyrhizi]|uniref:hypothetical protein n=1 Tax=Bradyrhizobium pachyrhizi TaxID=280333 RepID=UPI0024B19A18|nr:hypothetical protein [Bradyrhizobium pachyrhizi]WFU52541.1 hypothetical protein QA639_22850 [Bradyrhizobium pachyrhizi]
MTAEYAPPRYWEQFEELCADVFQSQFGDPALVRHGRAGQAQHGIDILARNGGVYPIGLQCKKKSQWPVRTLTKADVTAAINEASKFDPALKEFYILTTAPDDAPLQAHVATLNQKREADGLFRVVVLGWGEIVRRATSDPDVADKHFGPTGGNARRSPLLAVWMMSGGALEKTGRELELSVAELEQDLRDMPAGHFVIRQRESDAIVEKLKAYERPGLSVAQRQERINLREKLRVLTDWEMRAVEGVRAMLTDRLIAPWVLKAWSPSLVHVSVAAYVQNDTDGAIGKWSPSSVLRLYPPNDRKREHRCSVSLSNEEAASVMRAEQKHWATYKKPLVPTVLELPATVRARAAVPRIVRGINDFRAVDRFTDEQIQALGAFDIGLWEYEQA